MVTFILLCFFLLLAIDAKLSFASKLFFVLVITSMEACFACLEISRLQIQIASEDIGHREARTLDLRSASTTR